MVETVGNSRAAGRLLFMAALVLLILAPAIHAQPDPIVVPPPPDVPPTVTYPYDVDTDLDQVDDLLNGRLAWLRQRIAEEPDATKRAALLQELNEPVTVELLFAEPIAPEDVDTFTQIGGRIRYVFKHVSYGWWGELPLGAVEQVPRVMRKSFMAILATREVHAYMDEATRTGRVRPVWAAGFAGYASGFSGSSTTSIAILDSGVDGSHTDLAGRMVYWKDWIYSSPTPNDVNGHGSHVAGIACGTGSASGVTPTSMLYTDSGDLSSLGTGYFYPSPIHLPAQAITMQMSATFLGGGTAYLGYVYSNNGTESWTGPTPASGGSPLNRTENFTATSARHYSVYFAKASGFISSYAVATTVTITGLGDGFALLRGVAPGTNWVGQRVLDNSGSGNTAVWSSAIDDCVAYRQTYNIKVANMSLGTAGAYSPIRDKVNNMAANGILPVVAAGNDGPAGVMYDPARAKLALTVAAASDINQLTDYSSNGNFTQESNTDYKPDITTPGGSYYQSLIMSVDSNSADAGSASFADVRANDYANYEGTSMASPFAAGAAALVIQALEAAGLSWSFTSDAHPRLVKMLLCATATETNANREGGSNNPTLGRATTPKDNNEGYGIINVDAAVEAAYQTIGPGDTITGSTTGGQYDRRAWARKLTLTSGTPVNLSLTVPAGGDLDLYLYSGTPDAKGNPVILASSTNSSAGAAETIAYTPSSSGTAYLVIKRVSGSGSWSLTYTGGGGGTITVTSPNGGENWAIASSHTVTWTYSGSPGSTVAVELLKGGALERTLIASTPIGSGGSGSYSWTLADDITPATDYRVRVRSTSTSASDTSNADFTISKAPTTTAVPNRAGKIGETVSLQATLTRNTDSAPLGSRSIAFQVAGSSAGSATTNSSGVATRSYLITESLGVGDKTIRADFAGDTAHLASFGTATLTVSKGDTSLSVSNKAGEIGATVTLSAWLKCTGNNAGIAGREVSFSVAGTAVGSATTDTSGIAEKAYVIPEGTGYGDRPIQATFAGDALYNGATGNGTLTAVKAATTTVVAGATGKIGDTVSLQATLTRNSDGAPVASRTLGFKVAGSSVGSGVTNSSGVATQSYAIPESLSVGDHEIRADFAGDNWYTPSFGTATLSVSRGDTALVVADRSGQIGASVNLSATLSCTGNGQGLSGRTVAFTVDGSGVGSASTNTSGVAQLAYVIPTSSTPGNRTIGAEFAGDAAYNGSTGSGTLTVTKADTALAVDNVSGGFNTSVTLAAVLTRTTDSAPLEGRLVSFSVEGTAAGDGSTNSSGRAEVPYPIPEALGRGAKTIQASFAGDAQHNAAVGTGTLTVVGWPTSLSVSNAAGMVSETVVLAANLQRSDTSTPLVGRTVSFTVEGTPVGSGSTNASGDVSVSYVIPDSLGSGPLALAAHFGGDSTYEPCNGSATLTVTKAGTSLYVSDRTGTITEVVTLRGYLRRTSDNAWVAGRTVSFSVDGTGVGSAVTNSSGRADYNWVISSGGASRTIGGTFAGDAAYTGSTGSGTLTCLSWGTKMATFDRTARITDRTELKCRLLRSDNVPLYNKSINFYVDGTFVIARPTNTQGYASYPYYDVPDGAGAGTRTILCQWPGNAGYAAVSKTATLTVLKAIPYIWVLPKSVPQGSIAGLYAYFRRLYDYKKQEGKPVTFRIDGTWIADVLTGTTASGEPGVARYSYSTAGLAKGSHTIRCEFAGDAWVETGFGQGTLTVY